MLDAHLFPAVIATDDGRAKHRLSGAATITTNLSETPVEIVSCDGDCLCTWCQDDDFRFTNDDFHSIEFLLKPVI